MRRFGDIWAIPPSVTIRLKITGGSCRARTGPSRRTMRALSTSQIPTESSSTTPCGGASSRRSGRRSFAPSSPTLPVPCTSGHTARSACCNPIARARCVTSHCSTRSTPRCETSDIPGMGPRPRARFSSRRGASSFVGMGRPCNTGRLPTRRASRGCFPSTIRCMYTRWERASRSSRTDASNSFRTATASPMTVFTPCCRTTTDCWWERRPVRCIGT